jgi:hypothetical protein
VLLASVEVDPPFRSGATFLSLPLRYPAVTSATKIVGPLEMELAEHNVAIADCSSGQTSICASRSYRPHLTSETPTPNCHHGFQEGYASTGTE